jgi:hypothetical protein
MTQAITSSSITSFATELATLLIENETTQSDADRTQRDAARATYLEDAQHQVDALHAAADALETGALVGAAFSIAGTACSIGGAVDKFDADTTAPCDKDTIASDLEQASFLQNLGKNFSDLAPFANSIAGGKAEKDDEANAKQFETLGEQAKWQVSDASTEIDKADKLGAKILDVVQSLNQAQDSATNAVIGRI